MGIIIFPAIGIREIFNVHSFLLNCFVYYKFCTYIIHTETSLIVLDENMNEIYKKYKTQ